MRRFAKTTRDATQSRRLLALAEVYDGGSRTDTARIGGVGLQIIRDWVLRFNARGPDGLVNSKPPGAPSKLNDDHRRALAFDLADDSADFAPALDFRVGSSTEVATHNSDVR